MSIAVCIKLVGRRIDVDPLDGTVRVDPTSWGPSPADDAALEIALRRAEAIGDEVVAICAGPPAAEPMLRDTLAHGAGRAVRVDIAADRSAAEVAAALAGVVGECELIVCGDHSLDRGSGAVPAFLAARLGLPQALGCIEVTADPLTVARRTDRGGRDVLRIEGPAVISVDGSVARRRRAELTAMLTTADTAVSVMSFDEAVEHPPKTTATRPYRPRPRVHPTPTPSSSPLHRIVVLTDAMTERTPPRLLELDPDSAADAIVDQLAVWGYPTGSSHDERVGPR